MTETSRSLGVLDLGIGNVSSVVRMVQKAGFACDRVKSPEQMLAADRLILPGVGHFDNAMRKIEVSGVRGSLERAVLDEGKPILGICLGAQVMGLRSEEGQTRGLGWLPLECRRFPDSVGRVPHMQWNSVRSSEVNTNLDQSLHESRFYFVHSYYMEPSDSEIVLGMTEYGFQFCSIAGRENIMGVQFHPEKSLRWGLRLIHDFASGRLMS